MYDLIADSLLRGVEFLQRSQLDNGQFRVQMTNFANTPERTTIEDDEALFATAHIVYSLGYVNSAECERIRARALQYFRNEMTGRGLWRHWNKGSMRGNIRLYSFIPADLDDMASICFLLKKHGVGFPDNRLFFLHNRNRAGLFYTWLMARPVPSVNIKYWAAMLKEFTPQRFTIFFKTTEAGYLDVDSVVNANVALYLGPGEDTAPVIEWLTTAAVRGEESTTDKWYRDPFTYYYAVSRLAENGFALPKELVEAAKRRLSDSANSDGSIGDNVLHTALAVCTLLTVDPASKLVANAVQFILKQQSADGSFPAETYYYGGPQKSARWGSCELTSGICLEALARFTNA